MTSQERMLYQQVHPAKLLTDFGSSFASTWLLWQGQYVPAVIVGFLPSIAITVWLVRYCNLQNLRASWFGNYLTEHMPGRIVGARIAGQLLVWAGAIAHVPWLVPFGYFVILLAWLNGLWDLRPDAIHPMRSNDSSLSELATSSEESS